MTESYSAINFCFDSCCSLLFLFHAVSCSLDVFTAVSYLVLFFLCSLLLFCFCFVPTLALGISSSCCHLLLLSSATCYCYFCFLLCRVIFYPVYCLLPFLFRAVYFVFCCPLLFLLAYCCLLLFVLFTSVCDIFS